MAQCYKRKGRISFDSDISSPEGKKICESPRSDPNIYTTSDESEDDQVLEALNMTERIASQLEMIRQTLASVEIDYRGSKVYLNVSLFWRGPLTAFKLV